MSIIFYDRWTEEESCDDDDDDGESELNTEEQMDPNLPIPKKVKKEFKDYRATSSSFHDMNAPIPKHGRGGGHQPVRTELNSRSGVVLSARIPKLEKKKISSSSSFHNDTSTSASVNASAGMTLNTRISKLQKRKIHIPLPAKSQSYPRNDMDLTNIPIRRLEKMKVNVPTPMSKGGDVKKKLKIRIGTTSFRHKPLQFPPDSHIQLVSEKPFVLKVDTTGISSRMRASGRSNKRKSYMEKETDSDLLDSDSDDEMKAKMKKKKRLVPGIIDHTDNVRELVKVQPVENVDAPPPGVLPSLWYSRESCIHIWVIEKIIGWKKRPRVEMQWKDDSIYELDRDTSRKVQDKLINRYISDPKKRMEISRISPRKCGFVLKTVAGKEQFQAKKEGREPSCYIKSTTNNETEEVLLIKWRGRSHMHCSWERASDLERLDPTNNTAKGKIKRYYQSQYTTMGMNWKNFLEDRRKASATAHGHGLQTIQGGEQSQEVEEYDEEEFFSPDFVEVERILACDENKLDENILRKQRQLNMSNEKAAEERRQKELLGEIKSANEAIIDIDIEDESWDPEDYVRYVVKWKGVQVSEVTWEYWLHIKHESVDAVEDFWKRQKAPDPNEIEVSMGEHPHIREYKKLLKSPTFGLIAENKSIDEASADGDGAAENCTDDAALYLRNYQLEGVNWMLWNWWNKRSCILADEMGLGKTIQSMAFLQQLQKMPTTKVRGPFLVVAPLSLVSQWQSEAAIWAPEMNVVLYHGSMDARNFLVKQEFYYTDQFIPKPTAQKLKRLHITKFDILITTYEVAMKDTSVLSRIRWKALVVDEAHRLKNDQSRLFVELGSVPRDFCLLLTGTPLQNSTGELWSLLNFCNSSHFASKEEFVEKFGQLSDAKQVSDLHNVLKPYLLRRVKEDVEKSLPPKEETVIEVTLTPIQKRYYKAIYERNTSFLFKGSKPSNAPSLMNIMMELRKCCNHPFLIKGAEDRIMQDAASKSDLKEFTDPLIKYRAILADQLVQSSGKMVILMKLLPKLQTGGHKVLIFSQMVRVLDLLEELLKLKCYSYERLDGSTRASARTAAMARFNKEAYKRFVMLLSTRAGGLGLNLTSADTVIIFDSDWNPQNDLQAMARAHRIGQTRPVKVYRLLTAKTYEMHMFHSASMKLGLDRAVLAHQRQQDGDEEKGSSKKNSKESQAKEIDELLKKGAYDVFRDDDDTDAKKFLETDIDQILERSSRTVTYGNTQSSMSSGLGSFSKASFVTAGADGNDVDLDDPDFWAKTVGLEAPAAPIDENILVEGEKRSRKQVQVFDPYAEFQDEEDLKKEKAELKLKLEKEEKKRLKEEKKLKREQEKDRKTKERDSTQLQKGTTLSEKISKQQKIKEQKFDQKSKEKKAAKEVSTKKMQRHEQRRVMRSIEENDPIMSKMKQGWNAFHRDRAINATLLFGFGRFCKVRNETNLLGLPIQDIELFIRSYIFQLGLQAAAFLLENSKKASFPEILLTEVGLKDNVWVARSIMSAIDKFEAYAKYERELRMPKILTEEKFVGSLRAGGAIAALKMISFLTRLNAIIEESAVEVLNELGQEELGKRGYYQENSAFLDTDMKIRYLSTEEIMIAIGNKLNDAWKILQLSRRSPLSWWDRSCDLGLIIGTFLHGLGNYQSIISDKSLPFRNKIENENDEEPALRFHRLRILSDAIKSAFEGRSSSSSAEELSGTVQGDVMRDEIAENATILTESDAQSHDTFALNTDLLLICKRMQAHYQNVIMTDNTVSAQDILAYAGTITRNLNDRLVELVDLIENPSMSTCLKETSRFQGNSAIFFAMCNALNLSKINLARHPCISSLADSLHDAKVELDSSAGLNIPEIPGSISTIGAIALSYIDEKLATLTSKALPLFKKTNGIKDSVPEPILDAHIPTVLRQNVELRNGVCAALFCLGTTESPQYIHLLGVLTGSNCSSLSLADIKEYIERTLLPFCVLLCLNVEKDEKEEKDPNILFPDPFRPWSKHSHFSVNFALALLRRDKIHTTITKIISMPNFELKIGINWTHLTKQFPLWWNNECTIKLLEDIAKNGIFHTVLQRSSTVQCVTFRPEFIKFQVEQHFLQSSKVQSYMMSNCSEDDINEFIDRQVNFFPCTFTVERFLSVICHEMSTNHPEEGLSFLDLPTPDHDFFTN